MGNFLKKYTKNQEYNKDMILLLTHKKTMQDVHEVVEYLKETYPTNTSYDKEEFCDIFTQMFDTYTEYAFEKLMDKNTKQVDLYEALALITLLNNSEHEDKLDFLFRLFDQDQSEFLEITEFIMTSHAVIKGLTKIVGIEPPTFNDIKHYVQMGFFRQADENEDNQISLEEFIECVKTNWALIDWLHVYANIQTYENAEKKTMEAYYFYQRLFQKIGHGDNLSGEILKQLIKAEKPQIKQETLDILQTTLISTSKYLDPNIKNDVITEKAYTQVMKAWAAFDGCDINDDNKIDREELKYMMFAFDSDKLDQFQLSTAMDEIDTGKTGYITRQEWLKYLCTDPNHSGRMQFRSNLKEKFKKYDKNNSGSLSNQELCKIVEDDLLDLTLQYQTRGGWDLDNYKGMISGVVEEIMMDLDQNGDNECTWPEFKKFMESALNKESKLRGFLGTFK